MKAWRSGRDLSQAKVADLMEISQAAYSNLEAGRVDAALSTVAKASEVTGLSVADLLAAERSTEIQDAVRIVQDAGLLVLSHSALRVLQTPVEVSMITKPLPAPPAPGEVPRTGSKS
jgi:transcriptional regulator with XRE-family HTH domain